MLKKVLQITFLAGLLWSHQAQAVVNMAVIAPRVGELKSFGDELVNGVKIAVDDINAQGGIQGERINLVVVDDRCDDQFALSTAQMMAVNSSKDKMNLVIGPYCMNSFDKVADIYAKANIFQIIPTAVGSDDVKHNHSGLLKMVGTADAQGIDFYKYYEANFAGKKVGLVYDSGVRRVVEIAAAVQNEFRKHGKADILQSYNFLNYGNDFAKMARMMVKQGSEIVYVLGEAGNIAKLSRDLKDESKDIVIFTNRYMAKGNYQEMLGDLAEGSYVIALPSLKDSPSFTETLVHLRLQGAEPEGLGVYGYSAVKLWQELVDKADSFKYKALAKALQGNKFETAWGEMMFTNGNPEKSINYGIYKLQDGEYTQVY